MSEPTTGIEKLVYDVKEAAEMLSISRTMIFQLINEGRLGSLKVGHRRLVPRQDLEEFVSSNRQPAA